MNHSMGTMRNKQTLAIAAVLLVSALIAVYGFNVSWGMLAPFIFLAFFILMLRGGQGIHGACVGGQSDNLPRDEHAGHTPAPAGDSSARALAPDADARPLASGAGAAKMRLCQDVSELLPDILMSMKFVPKRPVAAS